MNIFWDPTTQIISHYQKSFQKGIPRLLESPGDPILNIRPPLVKIPFPLLFCYPLQRSTHSLASSVLRSLHISSASLCPLSSPYHMGWFSLSGFIILLFFHWLPRFSLTHKKTALLLPPVSHLLFSQFCITKALELSRPRQDFQQQVRDKIILGGRGGKIEGG